MSKTIFLKPEKFIHCPDCVRSQLAPSLSVGITSFGDVVINCERHDEVIAYFERDKIAEELLEIATGEHANDCGHKPTKEN